jgi:tRNA-2-methylthio-N6-dimethylallyladenosine synthase
MQSNQKDLGQVFEVLVEGVSRRSDKHLFGRNSQNKVLVFPDMGQKAGDYAEVRAIRATSATLIGESV